MSHLGPLSKVLAIHPTAAVVPQNLLRVYVTFSEPMAERWSTRSITLRGEDDALLSGALLEVEPELWDRTRRRLTVLLDPGRLKRGLAPHAQEGYPLKVGTTVELRVQPPFRTAAGGELDHQAARRFRVGPPLRGRLSPAAWVVGAPHRRDEQLTVDFERPLDRALLERCLSVRRADAATPLNGGVEIGLGERSWSFAPTHGWAPGRHLLAVAARLEDVAGNSVARAFDRDLSVRAEDPIDSPEVVIAFDV